MASKLEQLRAMSTVVADTADPEAVARLRPVDCTTNPSIVLKAIGTPAFADAFEKTIHWGSSQNASRQAVAAAVADRLAISIGVGLVDLIPGRVSTEVDADLSFDVKGSIAKAHQIIDAYQERGIGRERVLIKLAATWEGIRAAEELQKQGIDCNLTLIFTKAQAIACAQASVFLISPFVGRILDWHKQATGLDYDSETDPGVISVRQIYNYYKATGAPTIVMGASFRNVGQVEALAGCDRLTISTPLLDQLDIETGPLERRLYPDTYAPEPVIEMGEQLFRWMLNQDAMATEKLSEGIRAFASDLEKLRLLVEKKLG